MLLHHNKYLDMKDIKRDTPGCRDLRVPTSVRPPLSLIARRMVIPPPPVERSVDVDPTHRHVNKKRRTLTPVKVRSEESNDRHAICTLQSAVQDVASRMLLVGDMHCRQRRPIGNERGRGLCVADSQYINSCASIETPTFAWVVACKSWWRSERLRSELKAGIFDELTLCA